MELSARRLRLVLTEPSSACYIGLVPPTLTDPSHEIRALLLARDPGPRRICAAGAGGGGGSLRRCCAGAERQRRHDEDDGGPQGHAALCAAISESRQARHRPDRQHPALSRRATRSRAEDRSGQTVGAPASTHHHRFRGGDSRHASSARAVALLRRSARPNTGTSACRNISAISKGCSTPMAAPM